MALSDTFKSAYEDFLSDLSADDRARYNARCTPADLLDSLDKICGLSQRTQKRRFERTLSVISDFNDRMRPFFAILDSSLASCFPTFLTKLVQCIKELTESFPKYAALEEINRGKPTPRLTKHLGQVYRDLFDFFDGAASVFMSSNGKIKRPVELIATVIWRPFDERFREILVNMKRHQKALTEEIHILQLSETADLVAEMNHISQQVERNEASIADLKSGMTYYDKGATIKRAQDWLGPPAFASTYHKALDQCEQDTAQWIFDVKQFQTWSTSVMDASAQHSGKRTTADGRVLWIHDGSQPDLYYFFFKHDHPFHTTLELAYRAILAQILHKYRHHESMIDKFMFAIEHSDTSTGQPRATEAELKELVHLCLGSVDSPILVLDGIDECVEPSKVVNDLRLFLSIPALRVLLFSRPNVAPLTKFIQVGHRLEFGQELVDQDIALFCRRQLTNLLEDELLYESADITQLTQRLVLGADKMFLWARLMVTLLHSPALTRREREEIIHSITLPEGLEGVYIRIFRQISQLDFAQRRMASRVIRWTLFFTKQITLALQDWHQLLGVEQPVCNRTAFNKISELVTVVTCGLVSFSEISSGYLMSGIAFPTRCSFIHLSVLEHLSKWTPTEPDIARVYPDPVVSNMEIAKDCLDHLLRAAPQSMPLCVESGAIPRNQSQINAAQHERCLAAITGMCNSLEKFLEQPLAVAFWIQCFYSSPIAEPSQLRRGDRFALGGEFIVNISYRFPQVLDWLAWVGKLPLAGSLEGRFALLKQNLTSLLTDLTEISLHWAKKLLESPSLIWTDVLIFTKSRYLPTPQSAYRIQMNTTAPTVGGASSRRLCHISATSPDGSVLGVLSIWPSDDFEQFWEAIEPATAYSQVENYCKGWHAIYELSLVGEPMRSLGSVTIPLQASEIALQMRQAFRQELFTSWKASFPLSISPDGYSMSILRTVYRVSIDPSSSKLQFQSCLIPLQDIQAIQHLWDDRLKPFDPEACLRAGLPPTLQLLHRRIYTYCTLFNADSRYLFFQDSRRAEPPTLAVFEIIESAQDHSLRAQVVAVAPGIVGGFWLGPLQLATAKFHPKWKLIVFAIKNIVSIWDFSNNIVGDLSQGGPEITSLQLSTCGNYVIVARGGIDRQEVFDLRESMSLDSNLPNSNAVAQPHESKRVTTLLGRSVGDLASEAGIIRAGDASVTLRHNNTSGVASEGTVQGTSYHLSASSGNIMLSCSSLAGDGRSAKPVASSEIQLLALPGESCTKQGRITVYPAKAGEHHVSILVDKEMETGYNLLDQRQSTLPALIRKDERSLVSKIILEVGLNPGVKRSFGEVDSWANEGGPGQLEGTEESNSTESRLSRAPSKSLVYSGHFRGVRD
ncbi:hypothetical protein GGS23DRAFT_596079 [Durotheca rogersii]|uniref:uncharacterized protein n=1 Tax=Durotheca rogersii TaxID=419775 RepID=UPI00221EE9CC|nr:uncharacterized protein GGS23DRAFT_596079 [Durotheca rogersii]KAI5864446.1 hypothetical protein GGS23DRAFT_596079 [Durotheca rogersii]